jgi:hypothetical protein
MLRRLGCNSDKFIPVTGGVMLRVNGGRQMADYRVYELDSGGRVFSPARVIQCDDDEDALSRAAILSSGRAVEIWAGERRVGIVSPDRQARASTR